MTRFLTPFLLIIFLASIPGYSVGSVFQSVGAVVKIGKTPLNLNSETNCKEGLWGETDENQCRCCVLKNALQKKGTFHGNGKCLTNCRPGSSSTKDLCSLDAIKTLEEKYPSKNISSSDTEDEDEDGRGTRRTFKSSAFEDAKLELSIIKDAQAVKMMSVSPETEKDSSLTPRGIKQVLQEFFSEPGPTYRSPQDVDMMEEKIFAGGAQTDQLFGVFENKKLAYIVKVLKKESELRNLILLKEYFHQYSLLNLKRPKNFPAIAIPFGEAQYMAERKKCSIVIMPAAPGSSLYDITKAFIDESYKPYHDHAKKMKKEDYERKREEMQHKFLILGDHLGRFHAVGMEDKEGKLEKFAVNKEGHLSGLSRNVHGDFHSNNVFYGLHEGKSTITFIDPETLVISYENPRDVASDLRYFYLYLTFHFKETQNLARLVDEEDKDNRDKGEVWHSLFIEPFLKAYIKGYGIFNADGSINRKRFNDVMKIVDRSINSLFGSREGMLNMLGAIPFGLLQAQREYLKPMLTKIRQSIEEEAVIEGAGEDDYTVL